MSLDLQGDKQLQRALRALGPAVYQNKNFAKGLRDAARPITQAAKANVPIDEGRLRKSIGTRVRNRRRQGFRTILIGPRLGKFAGFHGHLVEFGTGPRTMPDGTSSGAMPPQPFMRPAADANLSRAQGTITDGLRRAVDDEARKRR